MKKWILPVLIHLALGVAGFFFFFYFLAPILYWGFAVVFPLSWIILGFTLVRFLLTGKKRLLFCLLAFFSGLYIPYAAQSFFSLIPHRWFSSDEPVGKADPLHDLDMAVREDRRQEAEVLIRKGADANALLASYYQSAVDPKLFETAIGLGADVNHQNDFGDTIFHLYYRYYSPELLEILLRHGADINRRNKEGKTPLHLVVEDHGDMDFFRFLLKHHADVNIQDENGWTPLHSAGELTVKGLLDHGADPLVKSYGGQAPWEIAPAKEEIKNFLIQKEDKR